MNTPGIVLLVVVVTLVVLVAGVAVGVRATRRTRQGPAVPDADTVTRTVGGFPVRVRRPPFHERAWVGMANGGWSRPGGIVDVRLNGRLDLPALTVLPRHRPEEDLASPGVPMAVSAHLNAAMYQAATRAVPELPLGDHAFDQRYRVTAAPGVDPRQLLSEPLRALLRRHDVLQLLVRGDGVWVIVFYPEAAAGEATEQAALQLLQLVVAR